MKLVCCQMNFVVICVKDLRCSRAIESCGHERQLVTRRTCSTWHKLTRKSQMLRELISSLIMSLGRRSFPENQLQDHGSTQRLVVKFACRERDSETVVTRDSVPNREHYASLNQLCLLKSSSGCTPVYRSKFTHNYLVQKTNIITFPRCFFFGPAARTLVNRVHPNTRHCLTLIDCLVLFK